MDFELSAAQRRALSIAVAFIATALGAYWWLMPTQSPDIETESVGTTPAAMPSLHQATVLVDVQGAVKHAGVVELPAGSRVLDAVRAAGGLIKGATAGINLARILVDGEQLLVGKQNIPAAQDGKVHLNRATESELEDLPGVGPVLAARLLQYREEHGSFRNLAALDSVPGVGPSMLDNLKDLIVFD